MVIEQKIYDIVMLIFKKSTYYTMNQVEQNLP